MKKSVAFCILSLIFLQIQAQSIAFTNGLWFDGKDFVEGDFYTVEGKLTRTAPAELRKTIDLAGQYVLPAFGDVNSRVLASTMTPSTVLENYMREGTAYVNVIENSRLAKSNVTEIHSNSIHPSVAFCNGSLICSEGAPFYWLESRAMRVPWIQVERQKEQVKASRLHEGNTYWILDSNTDVNTKWEKIKTAQPEAIVVYLYDVKKNGGKPSYGLSEDVAKQVIKKAKKSGIRVFAKVKTGADVDFAVKQKVDGLLNMPGNDWDGAGTTAAFKIKGKTLRKMAKKQIFVSPNIRKGRDAAMKIQDSGIIGLDANAYKKIQKHQIALLRKMKKAGVPIAIGSDDMLNTTHLELNYWMESNIFSPLELFNILSAETPRAIFPNRKVGALEEGYEANFIVLPENPFVDVRKIRKRSFVVRDGSIIEGF